MKYEEYVMECIQFDEKDVFTWLVDDGSNEVQSVKPEYTDK